MSYANGLGDASGVRCTITGINPPQPLAGVGPVTSGHAGPFQQVQVAVSGWETLSPIGPNPSGVAFGSDRLSFVGPNGIKAVPSLLGYDGQVVTVAVNFMGLDGVWHVWVEGAAESYAVVSNVFTFDVIPGVPGSVTPGAGGGTSHNATRVIVSAIPWASPNGPAMKVVGGVSDVTVAGGGTGAPRGVAYPGPGILTWEGSAWQFTPMTAFALNVLNGLFPSVASNPQLALDPFGLPLPTDNQPYPVPFFDASGTPIYSPWFATRHQAVANAVPTTPLPPTYQAYYPNAPAPASATVAYTGQPVNAVAPQPGQTYDVQPVVDPVTGVDLQPIAPVVEVHDVTNGMMVATTAPARVSPVLLLAGAAALLYFGSKRGS